MAENRRIFYAIEKAGIAPRGSTTYTSIRGLQSVGSTTTFNLQPFFEIGMITIYQNVETIPSIEMSMSKLLDGYCPIYLMATQGAAAPTMIARTAVDPSQIVFGVWPDTMISASGTPLCYMMCSGMYINSVSYKHDVGGMATEDVTFVGNNKVWKFDAVTINDVNGGVGLLQVANDQPLAIGGSGGLQTRQTFLLGASANKSILPTQMLPGNPSSGYVAVRADGSYPIHIQSVSVSVNFGREDVMELGRKGVFYKFARVPVEVTTEFTTHPASGDMVSMSEEGIYGTGYGTYNLLPQAIRLRWAEGLCVDCGSQNKLMSVGLTGGDTGGANQALTYTYRGYNDFSVYHPMDVTAGFVPPGGW